MSPVDIPHIRISGEHGFTLIELLIAMVLGLVVSLAAFSILEFTTSDVSRITNRAHVDQTGRVALEKIMLQLHSACVAVTITPIEPKSNENAIKFVSETSPLNTNSEPISSLSTVKLHEIVYTPAGGGKPGTLTETYWSSSGTTPNFTFNNEHEAGTERKLLTGVERTEYEEAGKKFETPIFRYYRYYQAADSEVKLGKASLGQLDPIPLTKAQLETVVEAEKVAKVTVSLTLAPEGKEGAFAKGDQPVALEDSAIFRFTPSSEEAANTNLPCAQI
jgi:prepilin-type N-terminal cleavage/methylation domain-containing protein